MDQAQYQQFIKMDEQHWWFQARRAVIRAIMAGWLPDVKHRREIIDVGSGTGGMLSVLAAFGRVTLTEPEETVLSWSRQRYGTDYPDTCFILGCWDHLDLSSESFDVLTSFDVLEHCPDDLDALTRWGTWIKSGGYLIISVPAFDSLWGINDEISHHYRRYTRPSLTRILEQAGFRVKYATYMNMLLFLPIWISRNVGDRLKKKLGREAISSDFDLPAKQLNTLLQCLFQWESNWLPRHTLPFGTSVVAVARKE